MRRTDTLAADANRKQWRGQKAQQVGDIPASLAAVLHGNKKKCTWPSNNQSSNEELCSGPTAQTSFLAASGPTEAVV